MDQYYYYTYIDQSSLSIIRCCGFNKLCNIVYDNIFTDITESSLAIINLVNPRSFNNLAAIFKKFHNNVRY
jgi:hypothetical protein